MFECLILKKLESTKFKIKQMKIHILSSTDRPGSNALKVANYVSGLMDKEIENEVFSLEDFPFNDVVGGRYGDDIESVDEYNERFLDADGILFIVPEYNGGFPGVLKLFIDYLPFPEALEKMPVSIIGEAAGSFGALRPIEHLQGILGYRNALLYPERIYIKDVNNTFDEEDGLNSDKLQQLLEKKIEGFADFVKLHIQKELVDL